MKSTKRKLTFRLCLALLLTLGITSGQWGLTPSKSAAVIELNLKTASQISSEANNYDAAIRGLSAISASSLSNFKTTQEILEAQVPKLKYGRTKLLSIALNDSTFIGAVKSKVFDKQSAEQFAVELAQDSKSILRLSGATAARDRIKRAVDSDVAKLRQLEKLFKENEATLRTAAGADAAISAAAVSLAISVAVTTMVLAAAAVIAVPVLAVAISVIATGAASVAGVTAAVVASAGVIVAAIAASAGAAADQAQDKVVACTDKADSKYRKCKSRARELFGPAIAIALEGCKAEWLFEAGKCLVLD